MGIELIGSDLKRNELLWELRGADWNRSVMGTEGIRCDWT